jgi:hypothetical protein
MQPDIPNWTWHEYGMRVGFWRIKRMLDALNAPFKQLEMLDNLRRSAA